ncbi:MAG: alkaline phosphatase D family protein [Pirellulales bacterium]|nr:alkaline phosphatase D family protein [Pirellulales bacterium]
MATLGAPRVWAEMFRHRQPPAAVTREALRLQAECGVASGDVTAESAVVWSRANRPAQMLVEYDTTDHFDDARAVPGPLVSPETDLTGKVMLTGLPPGELVHYRVTFVDPADPRSKSEPVVGRLRTPGHQARRWRLAWSGDTCGQGFGINPDWGGLRMYRTIAATEPDAFVHSGDTIYADAPIPAEIQLDNGQVWRNLTTPEKSKVAETLDEFRGNYRYNLLDEHLRAFQAATAQYTQWDDHETTNNWYPGEVLNDTRYHERDCNVLATRARQAFLEYQPIWTPERERSRIYRSFVQGPHVELFLLDMRTYRGANGPNRQTEPRPDAALLGAEQLSWLKERMAASTATWKIVCSDMPLGLIVGDGPNQFENAANGPGPALGRELEIADLLAHLKRRQVRNVIWLTADVHYAAAHYYDPAAATSTDFDPFWEFVAGPINAGTFGPGTLDPTFGPQVKFNAVPEGMPQGRPPSEGRQYFGLVEFEPATSALTVSLRDVEGKVLYRVELPPA